MKPVFLFFTLFLLLAAMSCSKGSSTDPTPVTPSTTPTISTDSAKTVTTTTAILGGDVTADGNATITTRGICWKIDTTYAENYCPTPNDNNIVCDGTTGAFTATVSNLAPYTKYIFCAYAINKEGISYGTPITFKTPGPTVTDYDGNVYQTVKIGSQIWMVGNLQVTHYNNGDVIPNVTDQTAWNGLTTGALCAYNNDQSNVTTYGYLYNYYVVADARGICPAGWHVPSQAEFETLSQTCGGDAVAGGALKEAGTTHWGAPNTGATNSSGFTALPGGGRLTSGFVGLGGSVVFWTTTQFMGMPTTNHAVTMGYGNTRFDVSIGGDDYPCGLSLSLLKN
jgi:uncharacterized protein (TIGR02145 family)